jgi:WD40 repeat protein
MQQHTQTPQQQQHQPTPQQPNGTANPKASTQHAQPVLCSAWSADGTRVFAGGCDKLVKMWDLQTGQSQQVHARVWGGWRCCCGGRV